MNDGNLTEKVNIAPLFAWLLPNKFCGCLFCPFFKTKVRIRLFLTNSFCVTLSFVGYCPAKQRTLFSFIGITELFNPKDLNDNNNPLKMICPNVTKQTFLQRSRVSASDFLERSNRGGRWLNQMVNKRIGTLAKLAWFWSLEKINLVSLGITKGRKDTYWPSTVSWQSITT